MAATTWFVSLIAAICSAIAAIAAVLITARLTLTREREADWRKLKLATYQEFILALSGIVRELPTRDAQRRYSDAVNAMSLIAPGSVLRALHSFQDEISYANKEHTNQANHDRFLNELFYAMRADVRPSRNNDVTGYEFRLLGIPPEK